MNLILDMLRQSGLSVDWMSIYVAWQGIQTGVGYREFRIGTDEVVDFAIEHLGLYPGEEDYLIFRIVDAGLDNRGETERCLEQLAGKLGVSNEQALRKWRFAHLKCLLLNIGDGPQKDDDIVYDVEALHMFWVYWEFLPDKERALKVDWSETRKALDKDLQTHREWLVSEEALLRRNIEQGQPSASRP